MLKIFMICFSIIRIIRGIYIISANDHLSNPLIMTCYIQKEPGQVIAFAGCSLFLRRFLIVNCLLCLIVCFSKGQMVISNCKSYYSAKKVSFSIFENSLDSLTMQRIALMSLFVNCPLIVVSPDAIL